MTGSRGFIWVNRCTSMLLDRPAVEMYRDGETTAFTEVDSDWGTSFVDGVHDFVDAIAEGRQAELSGEEGERNTSFLPRGAVVGAGGARSEAGGNGVTAVNSG